MSEAGEKNQQAAFVQSLRNAAEKLVAANPNLAELRSLNQRLRAEARHLLGDQKRVRPFGGVVDAKGEVGILAGADGLADTAVLEAIVGKLRTLALDGKIRAASVCTVVDRPFPAAGGTLIRFIQLHAEHRSGLAVMVGTPADENQAIPGVEGPGFVGYQKKVAPLIFAV